LRGKEEGIERGFPPLSVSAIMWGLGALFYYVGFYLRVAPAVITNELMRDLAITASGLGNLSALYFYSYVLMQIPTGILADHWGPRRLLTLGSAALALGTALFAIANGPFTAGVGRFLIGAGASVAFVAILKLTSCWFAPERFAMVSGLLLMCGVAGAVSAGPPLRIAVDLFGWRGVMGATSVFTVLIAFLIWTVVRDDPSEKGYRRLSAIDKQKEPLTAEAVLSGLGTVLHYRNTWIISLAPAGIVGPILSFSGLWGVPFLTTHYGMAPREASMFTSTLLVAWALGGPVAGWLSDRLGVRKPVYMSGAGLACIIWAVALLTPALPHWLLFFLMAAIGLSSSVMIIGFAFVKESVPPSLAGTVTGVCNMGVMIGPMVLQPLLGWVLDANWGGGLVEGARVYPLEAYRAGFLTMIACSAAATALIFFSRETGCRQTIS
jgi:sugar phosphate permease